MKWVGNLIKQIGGVPLTTENDVGFQNNTVVPYPDKPVNTDLLIPALGFPSTGPRPTGWESLTPAELAQRLKDMTESYQDLTKDKEILEKSGGTSATKDEDGSSSDKSGEVKTTYWINDQGVRICVAGQKDGEFRFYNPGDTIESITSRKGQDFQIEILKVIIYPSK